MVAKKSEKLPEQIWFNPFPEDVAKKLVQEFEARPLDFLPPNQHVGFGPGVYGLYYKGDFKSYRALKDEKIPIYVGKAVVPGGRKGAGAAETKKNFVIRRLQEHGKTVKAAPNLELEDFECRWLLVTPHFVNAAESILIDHYKPIWNCLISGFGIHTPGSGRNKQARSDWDTLHPGRKFAIGLPDGNSVDSINKRIRDHVKQISKDIQ